MCDKKKIGWGVGLGLVGVGVAIGAYAAKKYWDKRRQLLLAYDVEVNRLQNEVDFDYSEDFLKELKKEALNADKKKYTKEDVKTVLKENTDALKEQVAKLEHVLKEYMKKFDEETVEIKAEPEQVAMDGFAEDEEFVLEDTE